MVTIDERAPEHSLLGRRLAPESLIIIQNCCGFIAKVVIKFFVGFRDIVPVYQKPWNLLDVGIWKAFWFWLRILLWDWNPRWGGGSCQS